MVYRIYSEKRPEFSEAAEGLAKDIREFLGIRTLEGVRIINRYDAEGVDEATFNACIETVFSEPQVDRTYTEAEFRAEICGNAAGAKYAARTASSSVSRTAVMPSTRPPLVTNSLLSGVPSFVPAWKMHTPQSASTSPSKVMSLPFSYFSG